MNDDDGSHDPKKVSAEVGDKYPFPFGRNHIRSVPTVINRINLSFKKHSTTKWPSEFFHHPAKQMMAKNDDPQTVITSSILYLLFRLKKPPFLSQGQNPGK